MRPSLRLTSFCLFCLTGTGALAGDWSYKVTPYLWVPGVDASLAVGPNPPVEGSTSILDVLDGAFLITGEARRDDWAILGEFNYLNLSDDLAFVGGNPIAGWEFSGTLATLAAARTFYETPAVRVEALAGVRRWDVTATTTVLNASASVDKDWIDPIVGVQVDAPVGARTRLKGMANIGGFGVGSEAQWEVVAQAEWRASDLISVAGGYRVIDVEFDDGAVIDLNLGGPFVAVSFNF